MLSLAQTHRAEWQNWNEHFEKFKQETNCSYVAESHMRRESNAIHGVARVPSLGREDPLEKEMATHSSILAWEIPWMEEPGRLQSMDLHRVGHD